jgi:hypothetical protein
MATPRTTCQLLAEPAHERAGRRLGIRVITSLRGHARRTHPPQGLDLGTQLAVAVDEVGGHPAAAAMLATVTGVWPLRASRSAA